MLNTLALPVLPCGMQVPEPERALGAAARHAAVQRVPPSAVLLAGVPECALGGAQGSLPEGSRSVIVTWRHGLPALR